MSQDSSKVAELHTSAGEIDIRFRQFKTTAARWMAYKVLTLTDVPPA